MKIGDEFVLKPLLWYKLNYALKFNFRKEIIYSSFFIKEINFSERFVISNYNQKFLFGEIILKKELIKKLLD